MAGPKYAPLLQNAQSRSGAHPASCTTGNNGGVKFTTQFQAWRFKEGVELYLCSPSL